MSCTGAGLPAHTRAAIVMAWEHGVSQAVIARLHNVSADMVRGVCGLLATEPDASHCQRVAVRNQCADCVCHSRDEDFEIEPLTSRLVRKPGTCRRMAA